MNQKIKELWCNALRGGDYEQGAGYLHADGKYCCLGVLTDLYIKQHPGSEWIGLNITEKRGLGFNSGDVNDNDYGAFEMTPNAVAEWAGFPLTSNNRINHRGLSQQNDDGISFDHIADLIEEYL